MNELAPDAALTGLFIMARPLQLPCVIKATTTFDFGLDPSGSFDAPC